MVSASCQSPALVVVVEGCECGGGGSVLTSRPLFFLGCCLGMKRARGSQRQHQLSFGGITPATHWDEHDLSSILGYF